MNDALEIKGDEIEEYEAWLDANPGEDLPADEDDMDGDAASALASAGFGTDEDYGGIEDDWLDGSYEGE